MKKRFSGPQTVAKVQTGQCLEQGSAALRLAQDWKTAIRVL